MLPAWEVSMKPQHLVLILALLTGCAVSRGPAMPAGGDYQAMAKGMESAQAGADRPGDQNLTCDELQEQVIAVARDPAFLARVEASGAQAEKDAAQTQIGKGEITARSAATMIASMVPGAAMGHMVASAAENQAKGAEAQARMQSRMAEGQEMMAFMPQLMRGQRLIELAAARKCEWAADIG
jgi:hypothetical protein